MVVHLVMVAMASIGQPSMDSALLVLRLPLRCFLTSPTQSRAHNGSWYRIRVTLSDSAAQLAMRLPLVH